MIAELDILDTEELEHLFLEYKSVGEFVVKHNKINYIDFDYYIVNDLILFTVDPDLNFDLINNIADKITKTLPSMKRIFSKPVLHLIENNEVVPVESVRLINNDTITHIVNHSELWKNIKDNNIEPLKLLTKTYQDNYSIYENIVFCNLVDRVLLYTKKNIRLMKDLVYTNQKIQFNLLERVNHLNYFLALGKLHTGYIRSYNKLYYSVKPCLNKLLFIYNTIIPRLKSPVYKNNKVRPKKFKLHKTNILSMHKDYHKVYTLMKILDEKDIESIHDIQEIDNNVIRNNYFHFCEILTIFSIGHFNFTSSEKTKMDFSLLAQTFNFKKWQLRILDMKVDETDFILLDFMKDVNYRIAIIPSIEKNNDNLLSKLKRAYRADEYIVFSPFEECTLETFVSISNVESFRRIQQIILRGMIYSDITKDDCPFCLEGNLKHVDNKRIDKVYECDTCRTVIFDTKCNDCGERFYYTTLANFKRNSLLNKENFPKDDQWLYKRMVEGQMHYRNITKINEHLDIICPHCNKPLIKK